MRVTITTISLAIMLSLVAADTVWADAVQGPVLAPATPDDAANDTPRPAPAGTSPNADTYFSQWFSRVREAQDSQPHWITPIATVTPRLEEEFRFDTGFQQASDGTHIANYGMGKGLELIPTPSTEVILDIPNYENRSVKKPADGFADDPLFLVKRRLLSANEQGGNYIVTAFLGVQVPTGIAAFSSHAWVITPTLAAGKGWGRFDVQATVGAALPLSRDNAIGTSIIGNATLQYHLGKVFWPELEVNTTHWTNGPRGGLTQVFLTPGLVLGRFPIAGRLKAIIGAGYQIAVAPALVTSPLLTPTYKHQLIITTRLAF